MEAEIEGLKKFQKSLRAEDREVFQDLLNQCKPYGSAISDLVSSLEEVPVMISLLFVHYKMLLELERKLLEITS